MPDNNDESQYENYATQNTLREGRRQHNTHRDLLPHIMNFHESLESHDCVPLDYCSSALCLSIHALHFDVIRLVAVARFSNAS